MTYRPDVYVCPALYIYARARNLPSHSLLSCFADISHQLAEYLHASIHPKTGKTAYLSLERFTYAITPFAFKSLKLIGARVTNEIHVSIGIKMIGLPKVESPIMIGAMGRRASLLPWKKRTLFLVELKNVFVSSVLFCFCFLRPIVLALTEKSEPPRLNSPTTVARLCFVCKDFIYTALCLLTIYIVSATRKG